MTRETKIGLLIGLGFIVVFAVLLSHTGPAKQAGDSQLAYLPQPPRTSPQSTLSTPQPLVPPSTTHPAFQPAQPSGTEMAQGSTSTSTLDDLMVPEDGFATLPRPEALDLNLTAQNGLTITPSREESDAASEIARVAPQPTPSTREELPAQSPAPVETVAMATTPDLPAMDSHQAVQPTEQPNKASLPVEVAVADSKEYVVRKGDTLLKIAKAQYGTSATEAVDAIMDANQGQIKDRHTVREGQKILVPKLPDKLRDMVEPVTGINGTRITEAPKTAAAGPMNSAQVGKDVESAKNADVNKRLEKVKHSEPIDISRSLESIANALNGKPGERQAPKAVKTPGAGNSASPTEVADVEGGSRIGRTVSDVYIVKPSDTLMDIAKRELGSSLRWKEIEKLNKNIDPRKIKPGAEIKLPKRQTRPLTDSSGAKRVSA